MDLTPSWAYDPVWVEVVDSGDLHGLQTWQIYGPDWSARNRQQHYVCSVLVEFWGTATACDAERGCTEAWSTDTEVLESDCRNAVSMNDPLFGSLRRFAVGSESTGDNAPHPGDTRKSWADYGGGWERHGHAYPEALDFGQRSGPLAEGHPFTSLPSKAFPYPQ